MSIFIKQKPLYLGRYRGFEQHVAIMTFLISLVRVTLTLQQDMLVLLLDDSCILWKAGLSLSLL